MIISSFGRYRAQLEQAVEALAALLTRNGSRLATVESCTGGSVAALFTDYAGSSNWFERGFVTYSNLAKIEMVGVKPETLGQYGAVSEAVAREMAEGGLRHSDAQFVLSITGIAGPAGGSQSRPVGMVCFAWSGQGLASVSKTKYFKGDRAQVRAQSVLYSVEQVRKIFDLSQ